MKMIKIFRKLAFLSVVALGASFLFSCNNEEPQPDGPKVDDTLPHVVLSSSIINVPCDGGEFEVGYTIENPLVGVDILAVSDQKWVNNFTYDNSILRFTVDFNNQMESRQATVSVRYPSMESPVTLTIEQAAPETQAFELETAALTTMKCKYRITPADKSMYYIAIFEDSEYFLQNEITTAEQLFKDDYEYFEAAAAENGKTLEEFLKLAGIVNKGNVDVNKDYLVPGAKYVLYAYGIEFTDEGYKQVSPLQHLVIETPLPVLEDVEVKVDVSVSRMNVSLSFDPGAWKGLYNFEFYAETSDFYFSEDEAVPEDFTKRIASNWMWNMYDLLDKYYTVDEVVSMYCFQGKRKYSQDLTPDTKYIVVTYAVADYEGMPQLVSEPTVEHFTTGKL